MPYRPVRLLLVTLALALGAGACATLTAPQVLGSWGSQSASMTLGADGGTVQYQCGNGTIDPGWILSPSGDFHATGQHFYGGGPQPIGGRTPHPAVYAGHVNGDRMTLTVTVTDTGSVLGPFKLIRDGPSVSEICL